VPGAKPLTVRLLLDLGCVRSELRDVALGELTKDLVEI